MESRNLVLLALLSLAAIDVQRCDAFNPFKLLMQAQDIETDFIDCLEQTYHIGKSDEMREMISSARENKWLDALDELFHIIGNIRWKINFKEVIHTCGQAMVRWFKHYRATGEIADLDPACPVKMTCTKQIIEKYVTNLS